MGDADTIRVACPHCALPAEQGQTHIFLLSLQTMLDHSLAPGTNN